MSRCLDTGLGRISEITLSFPFEYFARRPSWLKALKSIAEGGRKHIEISCLVEFFFLITVDYLL